MSDEAVNYAAMSDDEFLQQVASDQSGTSNEATPDDDHAEEADTDEELDDSAEASDDETSLVEGDAEPEEVLEDDAEKAADNSEEGTESEAENDKDEATDKTPDFAEFHAEVTKKFKANGKEFQIDNAKDAIQLMQMGANYNKKMSALKPNLKSLRLLEKHGLLNEDKLNFLIDIDQKNPEAIAKLLSDSQLEPEDIDTDKGKDYKATARQINDQEFELSTVLSDLKESPKYSELLEVVSNKWDQKSKEIIAAAPQMLNVIDQHMNSGVYDVITQRIDHERVLGRLTGLSDFDAYRMIGDDLDKKGGFDHLIPQADQQTSDDKSESAASKEVILPDSKNEAARKNIKRKAASSSKTAASKNKSENFNPLAMDDEEFLKQFKPELL